MGYKNRDDGELNKFTDDYRVRILNDVGFKTPENTKKVTLTVTNTATERVETYVYTDVSLNVLKTIEVKYELSGDQEFISAEVL